jgi:uncharacterized protein (TIGR00296 family)
LSTLTLEQGTAIVRLARSAIESLVNGGTPVEPPRGPGFLAEKRGVFVTLNVAGAPAEGRLRGCIGFPYPVKPLGEATVEAARAAASEDPRFEPVRSEELANLEIEVSALTPPETISLGPRTGLSSKVRIGTDGLIVSTSYASGLLLPQVAVEFDLEADDFLSQTCMKAGLPPDAWLSQETEVKRFQAEIFAEDAPAGRVVRHEA